MADKNNAYWVSKYKAIVSKNAIAFFIHLLLPTGSTVSKYFV